jgi:hypothetical protein
MKHLIPFNENNKSELLINVEDVFQDILDKGDVVIGHEIKASNTHIITLKVNIPTIKRSMDNIDINTDDILSEIENNYNDKSKRFREVREAIDTLNQMSSNYNVRFHISVIDGQEAMYLTIW